MLDSGDAVQFVGDAGLRCANPERKGATSQLLPIPPALLRVAGHLTGKSLEVERLLDSLVIDSSKIRRELGWTPPFTMEQGLAETARWFQGRGDRA